MALEPLVPGAAVSPRFPDCPLPARGQAGQAIRAGDPQAMNRDFWEL